MLKKNNSNLPAGELSSPVDTLDSSSQDNLQNTRTTEVQVQLNQERMPRELCQERMITLSWLCWKLTPKVSVLINPCYPNINIQILQTDLYTFS